MSIYRDTDYFLKCDVEPRCFVRRLFLRRRHVITFYASLNPGELFCLRPIDRVSHERAITLNYNTYLIQSKTYRSLPQESQGLLGAIRAISILK